MKKEDFLIDLDNLSDEILGLVNKYISLSNQLDCLKKEYNSLEASMDEPGYEVILEDMEKAKRKFFEHDDKISNEKDKYIKDRDEKHRVTLTLICLFSIVGLSFAIPPLKTFVFSFFIYIIDRLCKTNRQHKYAKDFKRSELYQELMVLKKEYEIDMGNKLNLFHDTVLKREMVKKQTDELRNKINYINSEITRIKDTYFKLSLGISEEKEEVYQMARK